MKNKYHIYIGLIITLLIIVPLSYSLDRSRIDIGANIMNDIGLSGKYNTICLIDDGVDYTHPNLGNCSISQISSGACSSFIAGTDLADNDNDPFPEGNQQHGTQLAGIILSNHSIYKGIAGNSKIAIVRVFNYNFSSQQSETNVSLILNGLQWCIDNKYQYNISVISMSLGIGFGLPIDLTREFQDKINNATNKNILVIKSSGNREAMDNYSMTFPAELDNVTSVGSSTNNEISYFTRRTSGMDLLAPGDKIRSTIPGGNFNSFLGDLICWHNGEFISGLVIIRDIIPFCNYGTSFSAPHVSASVTLVKEYDPALKPFDIDKQLKESGDGIYDSVTGLTFKKINLPNFFHLYDWPTNRHDNRRTGTTFLKGDMKKADDVDSYNLYLTNASDQEYVIRTSIADLDNNGYMEAVSVSHEKYPVEYHISNGIVFDFERKKKWEVCPSIIPFCWENKKKWTVNVNSSVYHPPTLGNIDSTTRKEVVVARKNSSLLIFDVGNNGESISLLWEFIVPAKYSAYMGNSYTGELSGSAISDVDLDGSMDIIITDWLSRGDHTWPAQVYVLDSNGNHKFNATFSNGGAYGAPSIANIDDDDYPEIIVPSFYGVYVFDYDIVNNNLSLKWNNTDGLIDGEIVVYDVDRDNEYELVYSTGTEACSTVNSLIYGNKTCYNRTYIRDAKTGVNEGPSPINYNKITRVAPTIANLDGDNNMEIVTLAFNQKSSTSNLGQIIAYDAVTGNQEWVFNNSDTLQISFSSPDIADITGDGQKDIIFAENNGTTVYILNKNGTIAFTYSFSAFVDNALAIGDLDSDGKAEIALKRAGSPVAFASLSGFNEPPEVLNEFNITAVAGDLININSSGKVSAIDPDGNVLSYSYSSPFNSSGYWQTTINDTGNYDLSMYPYPFIKNNTVQTFVSVGLEPTNLDMSGAVNIFINLIMNEYYIKGQLKGIPEREGLKSVFQNVIITDETFLKDNKIGIIIGGPCANKASAFLLNVTSTWPDCAEKFKPGIGYIEAFSTGNSLYLLVSGYYTEDTKKATLVMLDYLKYNLSGTKIEVTGDYSNLKVKKLR